MADEDRRFFVHEWFLIVAAVLAAVAMISAIVDIFQTGPGRDGQYPLKDVEFSSVTELFTKAFLVAAIATVPIWIAEAIWRRR